MSDCQRRLWFYPVSVFRWRKKKVFPSRTFWLCSRGSRWARICRLLYNSLSGFSLRRFLCKHRLHVRLCVSLWFDQFTGTCGTMTDVKADAARWAEQQGKREDAGLCAESCLVLERQLLQDPDRLQLEKLSGLLTSWVKLRSASTAGLCVAVKRAWPPVCNSHHFLVRPEA